LPPPNQADLPHPRTLRQLRQDRGLAQYAVAEACGVDGSDLRRWERGLDLPPDAALDTFAQFFQVPVTSLRTALMQQSETVNAGEGYVTSQPVGVSVTPRRETPPPDRLKVLDLFCGAGGFSYGLEMTGAFAVTAGIDLLPDRVATFAANHSYAASIRHDIREISVEQLCDQALGPDIVVGGPPCQGFSSIRPFRGLTEDDQRNNLFESFVVVVAQARPRWFVLENVVGLLQHKRKGAFQAILDGFEELGYRTDWRVLNAAMYGLPQNRERVVVVGSRDGEAFQWPKRTHFSEHRTMAGRHAKRDVDAPLFAGEAPPAVTAMEAISDLPPVGAGETAAAYDLPAQNDYQALMRRGSDALTLHTATNHSAKMLEIIRHAGANRNELPEGMTTSGFSSSYSRLDPDSPSVTLTVNFVHPSSNKCIHPHQDRALTPREGARIQGFPDSFHFAGTRSKIVKQIGNAVPPLLGRVIGEALLRSMA
jgi:DNA (cytosine-5)-methyltransferase 1